MISKNIFLAVFLVLLTTVITRAQAPRITVKNNAAPSLRRGYFKWTVYLEAPSDTLNAIKEVVYTLDPSFKDPIQTIKFSSNNKNFSYSASGWGEFDIKVKIVYVNDKRSPLYLIHHLSFAGK